MTAARRLVAWLEGEMRASRTGEEIGAAWGRAGTEAPIEQGAEALTDAGGFRLPASTAGC